MELFRQAYPLRELLDSKRRQKKIIGFVPTMGALHEGHISLVEAAKKISDIVVCSIFVNPIQFNNADDLAKYPRDEAKDLEMLEKSLCDVVFAPSVEEIYPQPETKNYDFGLLDKVLEGAFRPGHFNGVAIVVNKLFEIVKPHKVFFGEKDFQQLAIIRELMKKEKIPVEIIGCPIIREDDGLAMSSRNVRLNGVERAMASEIYRTLCQAKENTGILEIADIKKMVETRINTTPTMKLEYFEIIDPETFLSLNKWPVSKKAHACIAVHVGEVRLIDNVNLF